PLWLGSHVGMHMTDFRVVRASEGTVLLVVSRERKPGRYAVSVWSWGSFGPTFSRYLARDLGRPEAERILSSLPEG
ncbi:MAG: nuclear receptor-binding factor 2, partial [Bacteroidota bacterium]|nr:nuclear receptor-binding factor 2 [Bacteroidota bacterium]